MPEDAFGNLLQHFTGSGKHNEALRTEAVRRGLHVSEYGIADDESGGSEAFATEEEVYERLGMQYIPPELRENRGELEAAREGRLPKLIELEDIRGDMHMHTTLSDGHASVEEMASAARELGYDYVAITDHSATHGFGNDVQADALLRRAEEIRSLPDLGITVLAGTESNVLPDGSLDYADDVLEQLDWVIASLHTSFRLSEKEQTKRMLSAMEHPLVDAIGHPTGRLIERREAYALDLDQVIAKAVETGTFLEINANPDRRDLNDVYAKAAAEAGVTLVIDSDAHWPHTLLNMRYGVATARRAWLTAENVANARPWEELRKLRKRGRVGRLVDRPAPAPRAAAPAAAAASAPPVARCGRTRTPRRRVPRSRPPRSTGGATAVPPGGRSRWRRRAAAGRRIRSRPRGWSRRRAARGG